MEEANLDSINVRGVVWKNIPGLDIYDVLNHNLDEIEQWNGQEDLSDKIYTSLETCSFMDEDSDSIPQNIMEQLRILSALQQGGFESSNEYIDEERENIDKRNTERHELEKTIIARACRFMAELKRNLPDVLTKNQYTFVQEFLKIESDLTSWEYDELLDTFNGTSKELTPVGVLFRDAAIKYDDLD